MKISQTSLPFTLQPRKFSTRIKNLVIVETLFLECMRFFLEDGFILKHEGERASAGRWGRATLANGYIKRPVAHVHIGVPEHAIRAHEQARPLLISALVVQGAIVRMNHPAVCDSFAHPILWVIGGSGLLGCRCGGSCGRGGGSSRRSCGCCGRGGDGRHNDTLAADLVIADR